MRDILHSARASESWLTEIRRDIHRHPELGFLEDRTASLVERKLGEMGIPCRRMAGTGVVGLIGGTGAGKCVALRADMDALPIDDAKQGELHSENSGVMHACGHDAHTACLLGAARLLSERTGSFSGAVKLIFQPAEETDSGGALPMIGEGVLENPGVDALFGLHADPGLDAGKIGVADGFAQAASDMFDVTLEGSGGHGAYPHTAVDVLYAACQCVNTLQSIVSRNVAPLEAAVVTVGKLHAGTARNVIPSKAEFSGIVRTLDPAVRERVCARLEATLRGVCEALGAKLTFATRAGFPMLKNDGAMVSLLREVAAEAIGAENVREIAPSMGVEDFAFFAERRPACFFNLGVRNEARGVVYPLHSDLFDIDESALPVGSALLAAAAISFLSR